MGKHGAYLATHRCEGSLRQKASIRYIAKGAYTPSDGWYQYEFVDDWDYFVKYMRKVFPIRYCPFCGQEQRQANDTSTMR